VGDSYEWITFKETVSIAQRLGAGFKALGLIPDIEAEDRQWRFMGVQSKNRPEWALTTFASMHQKATVIGMYDTLGPDAVRFIVNQT
jgi:long-chain acyl-CoA synthetase